MNSNAQESGQEISSRGRYAGPEDVYRELVDAPDNSWLLGLLAFAIVEEQKIEWIKHHTQHSGVSPTQEEITAWYQQQPPGVLLRAKGDAENALQLYSSEVIEELDGETRRRVEESVIVQEIRELKRFWPQFGVNLAGGFISSLLFALLLVALTVIVLKDPSPISISGKFVTQTEGTDNVKK